MPPLPHEGQLLRRGTPLTTPVPGWYPDPAAGAQPALRWWDGVQWTAHVRPAGPAAGVRPSGPTTPDGQPLARWWWRVLAYVVDTVLLSVVASLVTLPAQLAIQRELMDNQVRLQERLERGEPVTPGALWEPMLDVYADHAAVLVVPLVLALAYHAGFLRWRGATPGKLLCGLRARPAAADGRLSWARIAVRLGVQQVLPWVGYIVAFTSGSVTAFVVGVLASMAYFLLDALWATGRRRQALHDVAARTVVVTVR